VQWAGLIPRIAAEGQPSHEIREWRANFITNYKFNDDSKLKGWSVGGALRWQDQVAVGFEDGSVNGATDYGVDGLGSFSVADFDSP
ncbi:MAG: hypothetical protein ACKVI3_18665, partial [Verrucomicrobiia bacterium]